MKFLVEDFFADFSPKGGVKNYSSTKGGIKNYGLATITTNFDWTDIDVAVLSLEKVADSRF